MTVLMDEPRTVLLDASFELLPVGQTVRFLRRIPRSDQFEVSFRDEKHIVNASHNLLQLEETDQLPRDSDLIYCPRRNYVFTRVPASEDRRHRFVDDSNIPDVLPGRDIANPHWVLGYLIRRLRLMMFQPELLERLHVRKRVAVAMLGPSGTGKTFTIKGLLTLFYKLVREITGRCDVGSRVVRAKTSELLSYWFGQSDKNIDEFFNDIQYLASQEVTTADGRRLRLPVVVLFEEVEGVATRRGEQETGVYDRIIGMLLQRLDDPTDELGNLPVVFICTSNRPEMMDVAAWRRLAGVVARFKRLDREGLAAVLRTKLPEDLPYASQNGTPAGRLRDELVAKVVATYYSPQGGDPGLVEITLRDGAKLTKYRRDLFTGAVVEQGVSNAIDRLLMVADSGAQPELTAGDVIDCLNDVIDGLADNMTARNAMDYVDLPDDAGVASVRRLRAPAARFARLET
jgi:hypothetical protein